MDPSHILSHEEIDINEGLSYEEELVHILDCKVSKNEICSFDQGLMK